MKTGIVNMAEYNLSECSSAARGVEYSDTDFNETHSMGNILELCDKIVNCKVKKCKLKEAVTRNRIKITGNIYKKRTEETINAIRNADEGITQIKRSMEV